MKKDTNYHVYKIALVYQQHHFVKHMNAMIGKDLILGAPSSAFLLELILSGNYDAKILHLLFSLPFDLMKTVKENFLN